MKKLLFIIVFFPLISFAQEYTEVVKVPGKTAAQLYSAAREWFAKSFISENNPLLMDDLISGKIIGKGSIQISDSTKTVDWYPNFTIIVSFKDGRYKTEITDISITTGVSEFSPGTTKTFKEYFDKRETYKMLSDPEWYIKKSHLGKSAAKVAARPNQILYNLISKTESEMKDLIFKLNQEVKKSAEEW